MTQSPLRLLLQLVFSLEGVLGVLLNARLLWLLNRRLERTWSSYRVCLHLAAAHALLLSVANLLNMAVACPLADSSLLLVLNGPVLWLPPSATAVLFSFWRWLSALAVCIAAACAATQYLAVCWPVALSLDCKDVNGRKRRILWLRHLLTYGIVITLSLLPLLSPDLALRDQFAAGHDDSARHGHSLTVHIRSLLLLVPRERLLAYDVGRQQYTALASVVLAALAFFTVRVRCALRRTATVHARAAQRQRRFSNMLIVQTAVMLACIGNPVVASTFTGIFKHLTLWAVVASGFFFAAFPVIQSLVLLYFIAPDVRPKQKPSWPSRGLSTPARSSPFLEVDDALRAAASFDRCCFYQDQRMPTSPCQDQRTPPPMTSLSASFDHCSLNDDQIMPSPMKSLSASFDRCSFVKDQRIPPRMTSPSLLVTAIHDERTHQTHLLKVSEECGASRLVGGISM